MQEIKLDLTVRDIVPRLLVKQGDVGRKFRAVITDNGEAYQIPADALLSLWYSGTSGEGNYSTIGENSAFSIDGNTVTVELITQMLTNHGSGNVCLVMNRQDGTQIGTWNIPYIVEQLPGMGSPAAEQYFTALTEAATKAAESAARAEEAAATFETDTTLSVTGKAADAAATGEALAGKAPAGYGLGGEAEQKDWSDVDSITANGTYRFGGIHQTINGIYVTSATMLAINFGGSYCTQILRTVENASGHYKSYTLVRSKGAIGWDGWECPDPPMVLWTEYRTTKRWKGLPVYTKAISMDNFPANSFKTSGIGTTITSMLNFHGELYYNGEWIPFPVYTNQSLMAYCWFSDSSIGVTTCGDISSAVAHFVMEYTKEG